MPTQTIYVKTAVNYPLVAVLKPRQLADVQIQNLSTDNIYVNTSADQTTDGIKVPPNGQYVNVKRQESIYLYTDGTSSEIHVHIEIYQTSTKVW